jgi:hypothetical protein
MPKPLPPETIDKILRLDSQGWSQQRIADDLGLRRETVCRALHRVHEKAFDRIVGQVAATRSRHVARLEHICYLAMHAFDAKPGASFLSEARGALADVRSILGIQNRIDPEGGIPAAGSPEVVEAMRCIEEILERKAIGDDERDDDQDDDQDRGRQGQGGGQDRGPDQDGGGRLGVRPPEWF